MTDPQPILVMGLPRMRGDPPPVFVTMAIDESSTPHARGSTLLALPLAPCVNVYPACAGIHP
mgnify:CR=1 FL=1